MKRHLFTFLICASVMVICQTSRAQSIVPVQDENGRTVWVNNYDPPRPQSSATPAPAKPVAFTGLAYWSRKENRWIPVTPPSASAMVAARRAAFEVRSLVSATPKIGKTRVISGPIAPDNAALIHGHQITSEAVDTAIDAAASHHGVDPNLVRAIIQVESNFNPHAVSHKGAMGLMQLMPQTAKSMNVTNAFDPSQNVDAGVRHLKSLLDNYNGNLELSLAAYNAGSTAVNRNKGIPPYTETRSYVKKITGLYRAGSFASPLVSHIRATRDAEGHVVYSND